MSFWEDEVPAFIRTWLLEESDAEVRYLTLRDLQDLPADDSVLLRAKEAAHQHGLIAHILSHMDKTGFWIKPGAGYYPKYTGSVWSLIMLAQLGADLHMDERIARACNYLLDYSLTEDGQFTMNGAPSSTIDCLQGNLCAALLDLGCNDPRLEGAFAWMARTTTGQGLASKEERAAPLRYYATSAVLVLPVVPIGVCRVPGARSRSCWHSRNCRKNNILLWSNRLFSVEWISCSASIRQARNIRVKRANCPPAIGGALASRFSMSPICCKWWKCWWRWATGMMHAWRTPFS